MNSTSSALLSFADSLIEKGEIQTSEAREEVFTYTFTYTKYSMESEGVEMKGRIRLDKLPYALEQVSHDYILQTVRPQNISPQEYTKGAEFDDTMISHEYGYELHFADNFISLDPASSAYRHEISIKNFRVERHVVIGGYNVACNEIKYMNDHTMSDFAVKQYEQFCAYHKKIIADFLKTETKNLILNFDELAKGNRYK